MRQAAVGRCLQALLTLHKLLGLPCTQVATEGDSFMIAFASVENAVLFSAAVQEKLVKSKVRVSIACMHDLCCRSKIGTCGAVWRG